MKVGYQPAAMKATTTHTMPNVTFKDPFLGLAPLCTACANFP